MKHVCAFLSSAMTGELALERSALRLFFKTDPALSALAELYAIEEHASPQPIEQAFEEEVKAAHVLVLLLNKGLRPAVIKEFRTAIEHGVRPLVFLRDRTDARDPDLAAFIADEAYKFHAGSFSNEQDLCDRVRAAFFRDLLKFYQRSGTSRNGSHPRHVSTWRVDPKAPPSV